MKDEPMNGEPPCSLYECHKSGWMQLIYLQPGILSGRL